MTWSEFCEEMRLQYDLSELDDPMAALANLKQTGSAQDFHGTFIKPVYLVDATEKNSN